MRHRKSGRKLGRDNSHRQAMLQNMVTSLFRYGRIQTTEARAKELRRLAERVITMGKRAPTSGLEGLAGDELAQAQARRVHQIRRARLWVKEREALTRVFGEYADRFKERPGGYTRILKVGARPGDNADMVLIELVGNESDGAAVDAADIIAASQSSSQEPSPSV